MPTEIEHRKKPPHKCEGIPEYARIYPDQYSGYVLRRSDSSKRLYIKYCPYCGESLDKSTSKWDKFKKYLYSLFQIGKSYNPTERELIHKILDKMDELNGG